MDELREIVKLIADLPALAVWVLAGFLAYKLAVVGSIYGVIRFVADRLFDYLKTRKAAPVETVEVRQMLGRMCVTGQVDSLVAQIDRLRGKGVGIKSEYLHHQSVNWLREAIDAKEAAEREVAKLKPGAL